MNYEAFLKTARSQPAASRSSVVEGVCRNVTVEGMYFTVPGWDDGRHVFGPAPWTGDTATGDTVLVVFPSEGSGVWVIATNPPPVVDHSTLSNLTVGDPHTQYQRESEKAAASGYASLDASTKIPIAQIPTGTTSATVVIGDDARVAVTAWTAVTFQNSWVNYGGTDQVVQYRKVGDTVQLRGKAKNGTMSSAAFTLPAGFRPPADLSFTQASNGAFGAVVVSSAGVVTPAFGSNVSFSFNFQFSVTT